MIKFDNIQIKYGDFIAIDNLNLEINEGGVSLHSQDLQDAENQQLYVHQQDSQIHQQVVLK